MEKLNEENAGKVVDVAGAVVVGGPPNGPDAAFTVPNKEVDPNPLVDVAEVVAAEVAAGLPNKGVVTGVDVPPKLNDVEVVCCFTPNPVAEPRILKIMHILNLN